MEKSPQTLYRTLDGCTYEDIEDAVDQAIILSAENVRDSIVSSINQLLSADSLWDNKEDIIKACKVLIKALTDPDSFVDKYRK